MRTPTLANLRAHLPLARLGLDKVDLRRRPDLEKLKKRLQPRSAVALTLEAERILVSVVRLSLENDRHTVTPGTPIPVRAAEVLTNPERAGAVLAAALDAAGLRDRRCALCVPPGWALTASTDLPEVSGEDLRGYLELQAEREFPVTLNELRLAHCAYTLPDGKRRAALAALPTRRFEAIEKMLAAANRRALSVSLALGDTLTQPAPMLHLLAAAGQTEVVVTTQGGGVAALRSLPGPAAPDAAAEEPSALQPGLGEEPSAFDPAGFARELRITLGRLPQVIGQQVRRARFGGDPAAAARLRAATQDTLARMGLETVEAPDDAAARSANDTAEGAAVLALRRGRVPFEFVIPQPRKWEAAFVRYNTRRYRWIAGIALTLIFLPVLGFIVRSEQESHLEKRWAAMSGNVADLDALQTATRRFRPWFEPLPQNLQVLETLFAAFPEQGDVWAKSIQIKGGAVVCTGFARNSPAILALTDRLRKSSGVSDVQTQQIRGQNPVQFTLTYKWAPQHG